MAIEYETARSFFITQPGEKLVATLSALDSYGIVHREIYPVVLRNPQTATEVLIPSERETLEEIGEYRRVTSFSLKDAKLLFDSGTSEVNGLEIGSLAIRRIPDHLKSSSWDASAISDYIKKLLNDKGCVWYCGND